MSATPTMTTLLNHIYAFIKSGAGSYEEVSKATGKPSQTICEWVTQRRYEPSGESAILLHKWAEKMTVRIATASGIPGGKLLQRKYRAAFKLISRRFPVNGRKD